jgi:hypothetical protein
MNKVKVRLTSNVLGTSLIVPYSSADGLQMYPSGHPKAGQPVIYRISKYKMLINESSSYEVVRFGLQNKNTISPNRVSDAGLWAAHVVTPAWVPGYSPHSFRGGAYTGAWQILPGKSFLIHEGANEGKGEVGGSLGCVEVLGGRWPAFLNELKTLCGADWAMIGSRRLMTLTVDASAPPMATLV